MESSDKGKVWGGARGLVFQGSEGWVWCGVVESNRGEWHVVNSRHYFVVGKERRVEFWKDRWCGDSPICVPFPTLFALTVSKNYWVKDV